MSVRPFGGVLSAVASVIVALGLVPRPLRAQTLTLASGGPRFLYASERTERPVEIDPTTNLTLRRRISLNLEHPTVSALLAAISRQTRLEFVYSKEVLPVNREVGLHADSITVAAALTEILMDAGLDVLLSPGRQVVLVDRRTKLLPVQVGAIGGRVTDGKSGTALVGATVVVEGARHTATTGNDGRYRIADVAPGSYTVRARYIRYAPASEPVTVTAEQEATADFALGKSAQRLDEVVTTGTLVPTELKALPTPVSVISESDLTLQRPHTVQEVFRQAVPTAVSGDMASFPSQTAFSVRGASSLVTGSGQMKVFVDGIEVADRTFATIDPNSISRVEVIRGPQAAAIYGSDAVGGVIQVFTKRGDPSVARPQFDGEAGVGVVQTPYTGYTTAARQSYRGLVSGGGPGVSYAFGAGYIHTADWAEPVSAQSNTSVHGGIRVTRSIFTADVSGRYYLQSVPVVLNPDLASTGYSLFATPSYQPTQYRAQTLGAKLTLAPTSWWLHTVTVGIDRLAQDQSQTRPRLTSPADTFFSASNIDETKTSISYNTSIQGHLGRSTAGSVTVGLDHYNLPYSLWYTATELATGEATGNVGLASVTRTVTTNTGYFAQAQLALRDALFLTGGLRAEQNSNFGDSLGTPVSPQVGLAYAQPVGAATVKVRGSWGRAIRPPTPGAKSGNVSPFNITLPNPALAPERQHGWDAGVDAFFGRHASVSVTYFNQTATDLIAFVTLAATPVPTYQNLNVGRVKNTGVEIEGSVSLGILDVRGQYGYVKSRVQDPGPSSGGELVVGDQLIGTPTHTAGASLSFAPRAGTTLAAGATYVGEYAAYDLRVLYSCFAGTGPCPSGPGLRPYRTTLPSLFKVNATISQQLTAGLSGFVSVDNLTNNTRFESGMASAVMGRATTVGLQFHH
jgi:outer membrane receptor protein involved in Fe transport